MALGRYWGRYVYYVYNFTRFVNRLNRVFTTAEPRPHLKGRVRPRAPKIQIDQKQDFEVVGQDFEVVGEVGLEPTKA
jgi:hypothetical protein